MLWRSTWRLSELKALDASTSSTASVASSWKISCIGWVACVHFPFPIEKSGCTQAMDRWDAASRPDGKPAASYSDRALIRISVLIKEIIGFPIMSDHFANAYKSHSWAFVKRNQTTCNISFYREFMVRISFQFSCAKNTGHLSKTWTKSLCCQSFWIPLNILRQPSASKPDGPAAPFVCRAVLGGCWWGISWVVIAQFPVPSVVKTL